MAEDAPQLRLDDPRLGDRHPDGDRLYFPANMDADADMIYAGYIHEVELVSGEIRRVPAACRATIGKVGNSDHMNVVLGKAGRKRWLGRRPDFEGDRPTGQVNVATRPGIEAGRLRD